MQDVNIYNGSASLDVKLKGQKFIPPFFYLFVCSLFAHVIVREYRVRAFKKKKVTSRSSGRVSGCQTKRFFFFFFFFLVIAKILLTLWMHMHLLI